MDTNKGASCEVVADPHLRTCDGRRYDSHIQDIGTETIIYINYKHQQQVCSGAGHGIRIKKNIVNLGLHLVGECPTLLKRMLKPYILVKFPKYS